MNLKVGANVATFIALAVVGWLLYGAYKTGQALPGGTANSDYAAKVS